MMRVKNHQTPPTMRPDSELAKMENKQEAHVNINARSSSLTSGLCECADDPPVRKAAVRFRSDLDRLPSLG